MHGSDLTPELIWAGYTQGFFPMTVQDDDVEWFTPYDRALFPLTGLRLSRSLRKTIRQGKYEVRFDTAFQQVIESCIREDDDNWISADFVRVYTQIHEQGWAHSAEAWREGKLVGGAYGVAIGGCFSAESMFHRETDAGKVALWALIAKCRELGFTVFDAQVMNPHLASLGAYEIPNNDFKVLLHQALSHPTPWSNSPFSTPDP